jgi:hypothetical protein
VLDGGLFMFANGTNPEIPVFIEARADPKTGSKPVWQFAVGRLAHAELHLEYDGKEVFEARRGNKVSAANAPYWLSAWGPRLPGSVPVRQAARPGGSGRNHGNAVFCRVGAAWWVRLENRCAWMAVRASVPPTAARNAVLSICVDTSTDASASTSISTRERIRWPAGPIPGSAMPAAFRRFSRTAVTSA